MISPRAQSGEGILPPRAPVFPVSTDDPPADVFVKAHPAGCTPGSRQ